MDGSLISTLGSVLTRLKLDPVSTSACTQRVPKSASTTRASTVRGYRTRPVPPVGSLKSLLGSASNGLWFRTDDTPPSIRCASGLPCHIQNTGTMIWKGLPPCLLKTVLLSACSSLLCQCQPASKTFPACLVLGLTGRRHLVQQREADFGHTPIPARHFTRLPVAELFCLRCHLAGHST